MLINFGCFYIPKWMSKDKRRNRLVLVPTCKDIASSYHFGVNESVHVFWQCDQTWRGPIQTSSSSKLSDETSITSL